VLSSQILWIEISPVSRHLDQYRYRIRYAGSRGWAPPPSLRDPANPRVAGLNSTVVRHFHGGSRPLGHGWDGSSEWRGLPGAPDIHDVGADPVPVGQILGVIYAGLELMPVPDPVLEEARKIDSLRAADQGPGDGHKPEATTRLNGEGLRSVIIHRQRLDRPRLRRRWRVPSGVPPSPASPAPRGGGGGSTSTPCPTPSQRGLRHSWLTRRQSQVYTRFGTCPTGRPESPHPTSRRTISGAPGQS
jgi:hypothetical protein